jgi:hypothetical protein
MKKIRSKGDECTWHVTYQWGKEDITPQWSGAGRYALELTSLALSQHRNTEDGDYI